MLAPCPLSDHFPRHAVTWALALQFTISAQEQTLVETGGTGGCVQPIPPNTPIPPAAGEQEYKQTTSVGKGKAPGKRSPSCTHAGITHSWQLVRVQLWSIAAGTLHL